MNLIPPSRASLPRKIAASAAGSFGLLVALSSLFLGGSQPSPTGTGYVATSASVTQPASIAGAAGQVAGYCAAGAPCSFSLTDAGLGLVPQEVAFGGDAGQIAQDPGEYVNNYAVAGTPISQMLVGRDGGFGALGCAPGVQSCSVGIPGTDAGSGASITLSGQTTSADGGVGGGAVVQAGTGPDGGGFAALNYDNGAVAVRVDTGDNTTTNQVEGVKVNGVLLGDDHLTCPDPLGVAATHSIAGVGSATITLTPSEYQNTVVPFTGQPGVSAAIVIALPNPCAAAAGHGYVIYLDFSNAVLAGIASLGFTVGSSGATSAAVPTTPGTYMVIATAANTAPHLAKIPNG